MRKPLFLLYLFLLTVSGAFAQGSYPIFVSPTLTPPYSLKLSDYCKFGSQQLIVNITVNDLNISNLPVKLHIKLETVGVTIETPPTINTTPIYLDGGATNILFGDDLKDYFDIDNLIFKGYSKEAYKRTGQLPEGFYKITIDILHFQTNRLISNQGSVTAWISLGKPPTLKLPENGKEIGEFKGMPLTFSWLPSNVGSPVSANSIQYKFEVWEMRVDGISPYTIAATVPVFYEETTQNTMISLFPSTLLMERGMKYAWRITASDLNGIVPFEQDGHSEIRIFTYKSKCNPVKNLAAVQRGQNGSFTWEPATNHTSYNVELRKPLTGWLSASQTFDSKAEFFDLDYGTTYEMRVQAVCDDDPETVSDFSEWKKLEIPAQRTKPDSATCPNCGCGANLGEGTIANLELKKDLKLGDTLINRFGTTRFIVKSVEPQGDGIYKGHFLFWAEIWKLKFICEYWDLSVNTDNVILNMDFKSVYNPQFLLDVDAATAYLNNLVGAINELTVNTTIKDTISVTETITSIYVNAGDSIIAVTVGADGELHEVVIQPDADNIEQTLITGTNGEEFVVTRDGEIMGLKEYKNTGGGNGRKMDDYIKDKETNHLSSTTQVSFTASPNQKYGFDAFSSEKQSLVTRYPSLQNGYTPPFKSIASYSTDKVIPSTTEKGITFRDEMGIPAIVAGNDLTVRGSADGSTAALYAYKALTDTTEEIAGKLNLISFDEQTKKLYIVPVNSANMPDAIELQNVLNKVYSQALTRWEVVKIDSSVNLEFENGQMVHGGSSAISVYNTDQKNIISKFKESDDFERDALYLFFVDNVMGKTGDVAGFMPLQRQAGFIYDSPNLFIVAHELAHGTFNLRHTFSPEELIAAENTTQNLMDYKGGTELWKHQWALIHDPESMLFAWAQDESEGEYGVQVLQCLSGAAVDFALYYSVTWVSMFFDDELANVPDLTDFSAVTGYKEFSWKEAGVSAGTSCIASVIPALSSSDKVQKLKLAIAAFAGAAEGMAMELAKQYDITSARLVKEGKKVGMREVVPELNWLPILSNTFISAAVTAFSTYVATNPKYTKLLTTIENRLKVTRQNFSEELLTYINKRLGKVVNGVGKLSTRVLDATADLNIINRVKILRQKLTSDFKRSGNFGWAETEISGLSKSEYYAHSGIDEFGTGDLINRVPDISLKPQTEIFPWSTVPNSTGYPIARNIDTEYKILTEIAEKLGSNTNATGKIRLFTERAPCSSCSNVINLFSAKYKKIEIEIIHNNAVLLTNF